VRRYFVLAHRTLAFVLGSWILFQSATGFVLVFADQVNAWSRPELYRHGRGDLGPQAALQEVRARYPGRFLGGLSVPAVSGGVYVVALGHEQVFVDPATARVNGRRDLKAGFTTAVHRLHQNLMQDRIFGVEGAKIVGWLAFAWLAAVATGATAALTSKVRARNLLRIRRGGGLRTLFDLHRTVGLLAAVPLVLIIVTGIRLVFPVGVDRIWALATHSGRGDAHRPPPQVATTSKDRGGRPLDADAVVRVLHTRHPEAQIITLKMPQAGSRTAPIVASLSVGYDPLRGPRGYGRNTTVLLDQYDGQPLWVGRASDLPALRQAVTEWSLPVHAGTFAGTPSRLLWEALTLAVGLLGASGLGMNRLRRRLRRRPATRWQRQIRRRRLIAKRQRRARRGGWPGRPKRRRAGRRPCLTARSRPLP
jgi:uncharacterized iron-regulated membrane protein